MQPIMNRWKELCLAVGFFLFVLPQAVQAQGKTCDTAARPCVKNNDHFARAPASDDSIESRFLTGSLREFAPVLALAFVLAFGIDIGLFFAEQNASVGLSEVFESGICGHGEVESVFENF